jgi:hypothetical protein
MNTLLNAIAAKTPKFFAKMAAFSVALGVLSAAMLNAPLEIKQAYPEEIFQAAQYFSIMSWLINIICISQRAYQKADSSDSETGTPDKP